MFDLSGLPPGVERAMVMLRRGIIGPDEFKRVVWFTDHAHRL